jgi:hypothetical protein
MRRLTVVGSSALMVRVWGAGAAQGAVGDHLKNQVEAAAAGGLGAVSVTLLPVWGGGQAGQRGVVGVHRSRLRSWWSP